MPRGAINWHERLLQKTDISRPDPILFFILFFLSRPDPILPFCIQKTDISRPDPILFDPILFEHLLFEVFVGR